MPCLNLAWSEKEPTQNYSEERKENMCDATVVSKIWKLVFSNIFTDNLLNNVMAPSETAKLVDIGILEL